MKGNEEVLIANNNIMKIRARPWITSTIEFDLIIGLFYDNTYSLESKNIVVENNIVSSSVWFAYAIVGHECSLSSGNFRNNVAHSSRAGWFSTMFKNTC